MEDRADRFTWKEGDLRPIRNYTVRTQMIGGVEFTLTAWQDDKDLWHWQATKAGEIDLFLSSSGGEQYDDAEEVLDDASWDVFSKLCRDQIPDPPMHGIDEHDEGWEQADLDHDGRCDRA